MSHSGYTGFRSTLTISVLLESSQRDDRKKGSVGLVRAKLGVRKGVPESPDLRNVELEATMKILPKSILST